MLTPPSMNKTLTKLGLMPVYSAIPPQTPPITRLFSDLYNLPLLKINSSFFNLRNKILVVIYYEYYLKMYLDSNYDL